MKDTGREAEGLRYSIMSSNMLSAVIPAKDSFSSVAEAFYNASMSPLVSQQVLSTWTKLLCDFPKDISPFWGYEIPLGDSEAIADFLFCVDKPSALSANTDNKVFSAAYPGIQKFCKRWNANPGSIKNIWFEFDFRHVMQGNVTPAFFFAPDPAVNGMELVHQADEIFSILFNDAVDKDTLKHLLHCHKSLDGKAWIPQVGRMISRGEKNIRLFIQDLPPGAIPAYLEKTGYSHAHNSSLREMLFAAYQAAKHIHLDIDISGETGDTIGLECYFHSMTKAVHFLTKLHSMGLCVESKMHSLQNYLEELQFDESKPLQPFLSHIKIIFRPPSGFSAKIYLGFARNDQARNIIRTLPYKSTAP
jgi:hypothetical protein